MKEMWLDFAKPIKEPNAKHRVVDKYANKKTLMA